MFRKRSILVVSMLMLLMTSCGGPDAMIINIVHPDGSVTRKVVLTYSRDEFDLYDCQVPVDSTWSITRELEISEKGDSTWTLTAEKMFQSVEQINEMYRDYEGSNKKLTRWAEFSARFRWFNTIYRYSENVKGAIMGVPPGDFFTGEELHLFYMPDVMVEEIKKGADSTKVTDLEIRKDAWIYKSLINAFLLEVEQVMGKEAVSAIDIELLNSRKEILGELVIGSEKEMPEALDSLLGEGYYERNMVAIDTALAKLEKQFQVSLDAKDYLVQTFLPGELIATNGYLDKDGNILWKLSGDAILSTDYSMWAESKVVNKWAWIISFAFVIFVATGLVLKVIKRKGV